jgi:hypothetical protein
MAWAVYFWLIAAFLVLPLPFKLLEYVAGKDSSPRIVKVEEMANAAFFLVGLVGLYGFVYHVQFLSPFFWRAWIGLAILVSVGGIFWSPKIRYGSSVLGKTRTRLIIGVGSLAFAPMLVGLFYYSSHQ